MIMGGMGMPTAAGVGAGEGEVVGVGMDAVTGASKGSRYGRYTVQKLLKFCRVFADNLHQNLALLVASSMLVASSY